jgi:hypothetical protein
MHHTEHRHISYFCNPPDLISHTFSSYWRRIFRTSSLGRKHVSFSSLRVQSLWSVSIRRYSPRNFGCKAVVTATPILRDLLFLYINVFFRVLVSSIIQSSKRNHCCLVILWKPRGLVKGSEVDNLAYFKIYFSPNFVLNLFHIYHYYFQKYKCCYIS